MRAGTAIALSIVVCAASAISTEAQDLTKRAVPRKWVDPYIPEDLPVWSPALVTAGGVVFYGTMDGWFKALDARNGNLLWQFKTGSGIIGQPVTYKGPDGKQYVAIYSGIGGWMGAVAFPDVSTDDDYAALGVVGAMKEIKKYTGPGDVLYVFGL